MADEQNNGQKAWLENLVKLLNERPSAKILVLVDSEQNGMEFMSNYSAWSWLFGVVRQADEVFSFRHKHVMQEVIMRMEALMNEVPKGKAN